MKKGIVIGVGFCLLLAACGKSSEKEAAEIQNAAKILAGAADIQTNLAKLRIAENNMNLIAAALADFITDRELPPAVDPKRITFQLSASSEVYAALVPAYAASLPIMDPWGRPYEVMLGEECGFFFAIRDAAKDDFLIVSRGVNGNHEKWEYNPTDDKAGLFSEFDDSCNLINYNGMIIRGLKK